MPRSIGLTRELEDYVHRANREEHPALARCREETQAGELHYLQIGPEQAAFMALMARLVEARNYVEIGVFTGYSALAVALVIKELHGSAGRIVACDISESYIARAREYWHEAGVDEMIDVRIAPASETLAGLPEETADMIFVDADKTGYPEYFEAGAALLRPGGILLFDNVLWGGEVADPEAREPEVAALRKTAGLARADRRFDIAFTIIGDGLLICRKRG